MSRFNIRLYIILFFILIILILAVLVFPSRTKQVTTEPNFTSIAPTTIDVLPTVTKPVPPLVHPTSTGGNEDVPAALMSLAVQKQALRKKTPLNESSFTIEYDYGTDNFSVTLVAPKDQNQQIFQNWLKQNYPAIPLTEFVFR